MRKTKVTVALATVGLITTATGVASAQLHLKGSDTLFDPITAAIVQSGANLVYDGTGSGNGETALLNGTQQIAPMSRNLRNTTLAAHPSWAPQPEQVLALDAAVILQKVAAGNCANIETFTSLSGKPATDTLKFIFGGIDGTGSVAACSHPARVEALQDLADCMGVAQIDHIYRRDDPSGTTATIMERLGICAFCNGTATGVGASNLVNQDNDPLRSSCPGGGACVANRCTGVGVAPTPCRSSDNTQGVLIALSATDPGSTDVTTSIGRRVANDPQGQTTGFAGRESAKVSAAATKINIDTISALNNTNVRNNIYGLARRLFLSKVNPLTAPGGEEAKLLLWTTGIGDQTLFPGLQCVIDGTCGRSNMDPIMTQFGFVTCTDDPFDPPVPPNLCATTPPPFVGPVCTPAGATGAACTKGSDCLSFTCTGGACAAGSADGALCAVNTDCSSGNCDAGSGTCVPTYTVNIQPIFAAHCATCHTTGGSGGVNFAAPGHYADTQKPLSAAAIAAGCAGLPNVGACTLRRILNGTMPPPAGAPNHAGLSSAELEALGDWIDAGEPQ